MLCEGEAAMFVVDPTVAGSVRLAAPHLGLASPTLAPGQQWTLVVPEGAVPPPPAEPHPEEEEVMAPWTTRGTGARAAPRAPLPLDEYFESRGDVLDQVFFGRCALTVSHARRTYTQVQAAAKAAAARARPRGGVLF